MKSSRRNSRQAELRIVPLGPRMIAGLLLAGLGIALVFGQTPTAQDQRGVGLRPATKRSASDKAKAAANRPELVLQTGHAQKVDGIAFSLDGRLLASGSADSTIKFWDMTLGRELRTLTGHMGGVRAVAFGPNGELLASGGIDGQVKLWEVATGREVRSFAAHAGSVNAIAFSPDGRLLASGGTDRTIKLWETATGRELRTLAEHTNWVMAVTFSPDGQALASGSADQTVKLWEVTTGRRLKNFIGHAEGVKTVAFSPDSQVLASGSLDSTVRLWRIGKGPKLPKLIAHSSSVLAVAFSPDGKRLMTGSNDRAVKQFDITAGREMPIVADRDNLDLYESIAFSPDGRWQAASSGNRMIELRKMAPGGEARTLTSHSNSVQATAFSPDGRWFASGNKDTTVKLWDVAAGREVRTLVGNAGSVNAVAFSPDGQWIAAGSLGGAIKLWEVTTGREMPVSVSHSGSVNALTFSANGKLLVSGSGDRTIKIWEWAAGAEPQTLNRHRSDVNAASLSPDGRWLASGSADKTIKLWETATGREVRNLTTHTGAVNATAFSPDGRLIASASADRTVKLWETATGREVRTLPGHTSEVYAVAFSPDGQLIASASADKTVKLWDAATGQERFSLSGHSGRVNSLSFNANGRHLASGSDDGSTCIWETETGALLATLVSLRGGTDWLVVTPDGLFDGSPAAWSQILWRFAQRTMSAAPVEVFFNEFYYPDLLADVLAGKEPAAAQDISQRDRRQPTVKLKLAEPEVAPGGSIATRTITVKVEVAEAPPDKDHTAGSGARDVRLFRNGSLVKVWHGDVLKGQGAETLTATLPIVAGENRLTAYAFNRDNVKSLDDALLVTGAESLKRRGIAYILAVGVNQYANPDYNLKYAVDDARDFGEELRRQQGRLGRFERIELIALLNQEATKANILAALGRLAGRTAAMPATAPSVLQRIHPAQPEDIVVVYFAGHGTAQEARFYLVPHDLGYSGKQTELDEAGLRSILEHSLSDEELERSCEDVDAGHLLLVIDACNSGQALEAEEKRRGPMNSKGLAQLAYEKGMNILTAAQSYQEASETSRLGHGYLTYALVEEGLKMMAADARPRDGQVWLREWLDYATERVPQMQEAKVKEKRGLGLRPGKEQGKEPEQREVQRPRVFYRREVEAQPLMIAKAEVARLNR